MTPESVGIASAIAAGIAAIAAVATAIIAAYASRSWRLGLQWQREDECISALYSCSAAIGRAVSLKSQRKEILWSSYRDAWDRWTEFRRAYAVVSRYRTTLSSNMLEPGINVLHALGDYCRSENDGNEADAAALNIKFGQFAETIENAIK